MTDAPIHPLTPAQEQVAAAIAGGATIQAAAEAASVHRNTIAYWRRTSLHFREALNHAQYDKAILIREEAETFVAEAFAALHAILADPKASPAVRLNAAKFIIEKASTPPPPDPGTAYRIETISMAVTNPAQTAPSPAQSPAQNAQNAQTPAANVSRNAPCPCGSGLKFKRCCLGKPQTPMAA